MARCPRCGLALTRVVRQTTRLVELTCICCDPSLQGARADCRHRPRLEAQEQHAEEVQEPREGEAAE